LIPKLFSKPEVITHYWSEVENKLLAKACQRVHKLASGELLAWSDTAASQLMLSVEDYMAHGEAVSLEEMTECVLTLQAVVKELGERHLLTHDV
jgi:hypothetical protein